MGEAATIVIEERRYTEKYAHSMHALRRLGQAAIEGWESDPTVEQVEAYARDDFSSAVIEMIKTDPEFRDYLDVGEPRVYEVINGQTCAIDGTPMVDLTFTGYATSTTAALTEPKMDVQALRDWGDYLNAKEVDAMPTGSTRIVLSMEPKKELEQDEAFWKKLGYRKGIAYLQWYAKSEDGNTVTTGAYSVDMSDEDTWREIFSEEGVEIPKGESPNTWIQHAKEMQASAKQAQEFVLKFRQRYYQKRGAGHQRQSVSDYVRSHAALLDQMFQAYCQPLGEAIYTHQNNEVIADFAAEVLKNSDQMKTEVRQQLMRAANSQLFDDALGRTLDSVLKYAVVEELRKGLTELIHGKTKLVYTQSARATVMPPAVLVGAAMSQRLAGNVGRGIEAGRSYGGCTEVDLNKPDKKTNQEDINNPQDSYGGKGEATDLDGEANEACDYVHDGCYCCGYNEDGSPRRTRMKVRARRGTDGVAHCMRSQCGAWLAPDGSGDIGNIARKAAEYKSTKKTSLVIA